MLKIRPFVMNDFPAWLPLWDANNDGQRKEDVTTETWARINSADSHVYGIGAFEGDTLVGLLHYILHPTTGSIDFVCYMQDVFVPIEHRRKGIARVLVGALSKIGEREQWNRIYWLAEAENVPAQSLYKNIGVKLNFTLHVHPISMLNT